MLVGGKHHLRTGKLHRVKRVQKFILRRGFTGEKMHVINGKDIHAANAGAEGVDGSIANRLNVFVGELLGRDVANALLRARLAPSSTKPLKKMCFSHAATSMNHKAISN